MVEDGLATGADKMGAFDEVVGLRVGVDALDVDRAAGIVGLAVGVEDLGVDLDGVDDLEGTVDLGEGMEDEDRAETGVVLLEDV